MNYLPVAYFVNYIEANIVLGRLEDEGINCWLKDENTVTTMPLWNQAVGGIKLMVREDQVTEAKELLETFRKEKEAHFRCPYCNSSQIEYVSTNRDARNWFSSIAFFLLGSLAMPLKKTWHCFSCNKEFEQPKEEKEAG